MGDILVYRIGFGANDAPIEIVEKFMDNAIQAILEGSGCDTYQIYITSGDKSNFRYELYPEYKAQRKAPKPVWYPELRLYLLDDHKAIEVFGMEADDQIGIDQGKDTVICSIDKDLDQIPGWHFNFVKGIKYTVSPEEALRFFYYQLLMGDPTDNIKGIPGIGPAKAGRILGEDYKTESGYLKLCRDAYIQHYDIFEAESQLILNGRLLKIRQHESEDLWQPPLLDLEPQKEKSLEVDLKEKSMESLVEPI